MNFVEKINQLFSHPETLLNKDRLKQYAVNSANAVHRAITEDYKPTFRLRMSNMGYPLRKLYWLIKHGRQPLDAETKIKMLTGHLTEEMVMFLLESAGCQVTNAQMELQYRGYTGHIDCIVDGWLVDVKTASAFSYDKFSKGLDDESDSFGYRFQLAAYYKVLTEVHNIKLNGCGWLVYNKNNSALKFIEFDPTTVDVDAIIDQVDGLERAELPELCYQPKPEGQSGNMALPTGCAYCDFKKLCYPELRAFKYSNGIKYLTKVEKEPNVPEVNV